MSAAPRDEPEHHCTQVFIGKSRSVLESLPRNGAVQSEGGHGLKASVGLEELFLGIPYQLSLHPGLKEFVCLSEILAEMGALLQGKTRKRRKIVANLLGKTIIAHHFKNLNFFSSLETLRGFSFAFQSVFLAL